MIFGLYQPLTPYVARKADKSVATDVAAVMPLASMEAMKVKVDETVRSCVNAFFYIFSSVFMLHYTVAILQ